MELFYECWLYAVLFEKNLFHFYLTGVFIGLGLSGVIPAMHYVITDGFWAAVNYAALGWLVLMAVLYILGALIYACRVPERIWPGKFDIWVCVIFMLAVFLVMINKVLTVPSCWVTSHVCTCNWICFSLFSNIDFFVVPEPSDIPHICHSCCIRALPWHIRDCYLPTQLWRLCWKPVASLVIIELPSTWMDNVHFTDMYCSVLAFTLCLCMNICIANCLYLYLWNVFSIIFHQCC